MGAVTPSRLGEGSGYTPDRKGEHPRQHLSASPASCRPTDTRAFIILYEGGRIVEAACWAHVRRKFYDIQVANGSAIAAEAVERIGALYDIEREIRGKPADCDARFARHGPGPLVEELHRWLNTTLTQTLTQVRYGGGDSLCAVALACAHALSR